MKKQPNLNDLPSVSFEDFQNVYQESLKIEDCDKVIDSLYKIKSDLQITSDRRCVKAYKAMKVSAVLRGAHKVSAKVLMILQHILWDEPSKQPEVSAKIAQYVGSKIRDAVALSEQLLRALGLDPNLLKDYKLE